MILARREPPRASTFQVLGLSTSFCYPRGINPAKIVTPYGPIDFWISERDESRIQEALPFTMKAIKRQTRNEIVSIMILELLMQNI